MAFTFGILFRLSQSYIASTPVIYGFTISNPNMVTLTNVAKELIKFEPTKPLIPVIRMFIYYQIIIGVVKVGRH